MQFIQTRKLHRLLVVIAVIGIVFTPFARAQHVWLSSSGTTNGWSEILNWNIPAVPGEFDTVIFDNSAPPATTNAAGLVNNVVDVGNTILRLQYSAFSNLAGANFHTTEIPAGKTLTVRDGTSAETLFVGTGTAETIDAQVVATIRGAGTLVVTNPFGIINIRQGNAATGPHRSTLDLSGLNTFHGVVTRVQLAGDGTSGTISQTARPSGTLQLAKTNIIATTTATAGDGLRIGTTAGNLNSATWGQNAILTLGQTNLILSDAGITVAGTRSTGLMMFQPGLVNPTAVFRNLIGTGRQNTWFVGENNSSNTGNASTGTLDLTGGSVDALISSLFVGRGQSYGTTSDAGPSTGHFAFNAGLVDVTSVEIAQRRNNYGGPTRGFITVGGSGQFIVSGTFRVGFDRTIVATNQACAGTLTITNGGFVWAKSGIIDGGFGTNIISVTAGHLRSGGQLGRLLSATDRPLDELSLTNATLTLTVNASINATNPACSVTNLNIATALTLNVEGGGFALGQYPLIKYYSAAIGGDGYAAITTGSLPSRAEGYLSNNVANRSIDLVVTNISAARWNGTPDGKWDISQTPNWIDLATSAATTYFEDAPPGDTVIFNDAATGTTTVDVTTNVSPALISITNSTKTYVYTGSGKISGITSLNKSGSGLVILTNAGANDFTGPVSINDGTLQLGLAPNRLPAVNVTIANLPSAGLVLGDQDQTVAALNGGGTINVGTANFTTTASGAYNGVVSGSGMFRKTGGGTQTLGGANTYSGGTHMAGSITLVNTSGSGLGSGDVNIASGTLNIGNGGAGALTGSTHITNAGTLTFNATNDLAVGGIHGSGAVNKVNTNTVTITGPSTFTAAITLASGAIRLAHGDALGDAGGVTTIDNVGDEHVEFTGDIMVPENFSLQMKAGADSATAAHFVNVSGTNTMTGTVVGTAGGSHWTFRADGGKLNFNGNMVNNASSYRWVRLTGAAVGEWMTTLADGGGGVGTGTRLLKDGSGTWIVSSYNVYTGETAIEDGRLLLTSGGTITSPWLLKVGNLGSPLIATLTGTGTILSPVVVYTNGVLAPGESIGTLTVQNILTNLGTCRFDVNSDTLQSDLVTGMTEVVYGGTLQLALSGGNTALTNGAGIKLFDAAAYSGAFAAIVPTTPGPGLSWNTSQLTVNGTLGVSTGPSTTPTSLTFGAVGGQLNISWPLSHTGWRLEGQTNSLNVGLSTNWFTVSGSTTTNQVIMPINSGNGAVFYRLVYP